MIIRRLALVGALLSFAGCLSKDKGDMERIRRTIDGYDTQIRWTSYGIPHVKANDWGSLGYGFAYATATDAICVIARGSGDGERQPGGVHGCRKRQRCERCISSSTANGKKTATFLRRHKPLT